MEPELSSPRSQEPTTELYPPSDESSSSPYVLTRLGAGRPGFDAQHGQGFFSFPIRP